MRRDRIIARILLLFTVANVALAAPAVVRQRHMDVAEAARKRGNAGSHPTVSGQTSSGSSDSFWNPYPPSDSEDEVQSQAESNSVHRVSDTASQIGSHPANLVSDAESQVGSNLEHTDFDHESQVGSNVGHPDSDHESLSGGLAHDPPPESNGVITSDLTQKLEKGSIWGAVAAFSAGVTYKILKKTGLSRIADRMRARPRMVLPDNPQPRKHPVS